MVHPKGDRTVADRFHLEGKISLRSGGAANTGMAVDTKGKHKRALPVRFGTGQDLGRPAEE